MKNWEYVGCDIYKKWRVRVLYKDYLPEGETRKIGDPTGEEQIEVNFNTKHQFVYPYVSGWLYGKWTHNPTDITKEPNEHKKFCNDIWTNEFKHKYKQWRESVGQHFN